MAEKVVHISTVHPPFDVRIFHKECKSLHKAGYEVFLVVTHEKDEIRDGIQILSLPQSSNRFQRIFFKPWLALKRALETGANIFHFHDPELIPIGLILRVLGKKVIYDVHEDYPKDILEKYWLPKKLRGLISKIIYIIELYSSKMINGIVTATPSIYEKFKIKKNCICINNYPIISEVEKFNNFIKEPLSIAYVGGITEKRGILQTIDAIRGTNIKLYLAGEFYPNSLYDECQKNTGWKNVEYLGVISRHEATLLLKKVNIGIILFHMIPNHEKCSPNKMFEYMLAGLPIVASNIPYWKEFLKDIDCAVFADPLNPQEIRDAILQLLENPEKANKMGSYGQHAVLDKYNWTSEESKLINFYKTL